jgi:hypothetical protein
MEATSTAGATCQDRRNVRAQLLGHGDPVESDPPAHPWSASDAFVQPRRTATPADHARCHRGRLRAALEECDARAAASLPARQDGRKIQPLFSPAQSDHRRCPPVHGADPVRTLLQIQRAFPYLSQLPLIQIPPAGRRQSLALRIVDCRNADKTRSAGIPLDLVQTP